MDDDVAAYVAIDRLQRAYAEAATRKAWDEMVTLAAPGAVFGFQRHSGDSIEVDVDAFVGFAISATEQFSFYEYVPLNAVVEIDGETATGRFYNLEIGVDATTGEWIDFYGVYDDEYVRIDGTWMFQKRSYRTLIRKVDGRPEPPKG